MEVLMDKDGLRRQILHKRLSMSAAERADKQVRILKHLLTVPHLQQAETILLYLDFRGEVETEQIFRWGWNAGKTMAVPVSKPAERKIIPVRLNSFEELTAGPYGIREPDMHVQLAAGHLNALPDALSVQELDVVIVPGVAFDRKGGRLGYGGGYYDRFLPQLRPNALKIGIAYQLQMVEQLPMETHDIPLDLIVTEKSVYHGRRAAF
ncbi:5-formyltetrahydrofolate cyclo-ligase [Effusibacillus dendaii]|uniref:5-formyltetrahydrofolate cyclo-ligase n=1 Tax=Effusibacillus dendaii TaxID=2743772 RepID=A0A7I8DAG8_9BACL|nr:5-formyltetrahydrofolate cyclo-ligase [Effusibacillus dendaii]BCJ87183.1 5-formyltetrahydrofolate cyclo-ligase [Effusibacillus dendaii]